MKHSRLFAAILAVSLAIVAPSYAETEVKAFASTAIETLAVNTKKNCTDLPNISLNCITIGGGTILNHQTLFMQAATKSTQRAPAVDALEAAMADGRGGGTILNHQTLFMQAATKSTQRAPAVDALVLPEFLAPEQQLMAVNFWAC